MRKVFDIIESSTIREIEYVESVKSLIVRFRNGASYKYQNVPKEVAMSAAASEKISTFLNNEIKGKYQHFKI